MKASFLPQFQDETEICSHRDSSSTQFRGKGERIEDGYKEDVKVGYRQGSTIPSGPSYCSGKSSQYTKKV